MNPRSVFLLVLAFLFSFNATSQQNDFSIIDNSDFANILKYNVKTCHTYLTTTEGEKQDTALVNVSYFNPSGLITKEIDYDFPDTNTIWTLSAQYAPDIKIISEQWVWSKFEIDSTFYQYNEEGQLESECTKHYQNSIMEELFCDSFYYENGHRISSTSPDKDASYFVDKEDSVFNHYPDGRLHFILVNDKQVKAYGYDINNKLNLIYYYTYNSYGDFSRAVVRDPEGKLIKEVTYFYDGSLILEIATNNFELGELTTVEFTYTYYDQ
ncbi:MAG: hypothetical protein ACI8ZM_001001 [Crocinitomix sp.]|jgi:hypothetical protein